MKHITSLFILVVGLVTAANGQQSWIRINQVGYTLDAVKVAVLGSKAEDLSVTSFEIVDVLTGKTVHKSNKIRSFGAYASFGKIFRLDFSDFSENGTFFIRAGKVESPPFPIDETVYNGAADFLL
ncbi:MAG: hypothetical protein KDE57_13445, partial [Calditrichaeota bacterium]|nr:hypothetical protein [Calditrichota bacterium]